MSSSWELVLEDAYTYEVAKILRDSCVSSISALGRLECPGYHAIRSSLSPLGLNPYKVMVIN